MSADILSREQRLRKQAELQSLYTNLANLRDREASYIQSSAPVPEFFLKQLNELRQQIIDVENELASLGSQASMPVDQEVYHQAFEAELNGDISTALKLYKSAGRHGYTDANAAIRSVRYQNKMAKEKTATAGKAWPPADAGSSGRTILVGVGVLLLLVLVAGFVLLGPTTLPPQGSVAGVELTATVTPTPLTTDMPVPTVSPTNTAIPVPTSTNTPQLLSVDVAIPTDTPVPADTPTPVHVPTLRPPPKIIGPDDGLVWGDGTIVFEFEDYNLNYDELYCLNTLRGYDKTNTENWSYEPVGRKVPYIPIDANAFHVAKSQNIECVVWSGYIAKETCANAISQSTEERVIGLPRPCIINKK